MTLENIYYIGQTIAVIAILGSLFAIWVQMRQSQKMERAAAQREILDKVSAFARGFTPEEGDLWLLGLHDFNNASPEAKSLCHARFSEFIFITESALGMQKDGFFTAGTWAGIEGVMLSILRTPGGSQMWAFTQHYVGFEIADHLNQRMAEEGPDGPTILDAIPYQKERLEELLQDGPSRPSPETAEVEPSA